MVSGWERALQALCALAYLATVADAFRLPFLALPTRRLGGDAAGPRVTAPPSPGAVDLRFRRQNNGGGGLQCASSCVSAAVTKSTNCQVDDVICGCQADNAYKILYGAEVCIVLTCGYQAYVTAATKLANLCATAGGVAFPTTFAGFTAAVPTLDLIPPVTTNTGGRGSPGGSTATVGMAGTTISVIPSASTPTSSSSSGSLSPGATAGVAVGAAAGAIALCAVLFLVYRRTKKKATQTDTIVSAVGPTAAAGGGGGPVLFQPELDGQGTKPSLYTETVSPAPTSVSYGSGGGGFAPSPGTAVTMGSSPSSSPPPVYPGAWLQQPYGGVQQPQAVQPGGPAQYVHEVPGGREAPGDNAHEVHGASAAREMAADTHLPHEMPGHSGLVYEMPTTTAAATATTATTTAPR